MDGESYVTSSLISNINKIILKDLLVEGSFNREETASQTDSIKKETNSNFNEVKKTRKTKNIINHTLTEIIETEQSYIKDLEMVNMIL